MSFFRFARDERGLVLSEYLGLLGGIVVAGVASVVVLSGALGGVAQQTLGDDADGSGGYLAKSGGPLLTTVAAGTEGSDGTGTGGSGTGDTGTGGTGTGGTGTGDTGTGTGDTGAGGTTTGGTTPVATLIQRSRNGDRAQYAMPDGKKQWFDCTTASPCGETRPAS